MSYDSRPDTYAHIHLVQGLITLFTLELMQRALFHDQSKLVDPEVAAFDILTPRLKDLTYGSDAYRACLKEMKPALDHHYAANDHHPDHFPNGIRDMNLLQVVEMLCDWKAASMRHADGNILTSIEHNQNRFGYSDELKQIFLNTVPFLDTIRRPRRPESMPPSDPKSEET